MAKQKKVKTNAVRILDGEGISYELMEYNVDDGLLDGVSVAEKTGQVVTTVYKTLVTIAAPRELFVFLVPVAAELDLKKAARAAGVKKLRYASAKGFNERNRLCPWRLFGSRDEKEIPDVYGQVCRNT